MAGILDGFEDDFFVAERRIRPRPVSVRSLELAVAAWDYKETARLREEAAAACARELLASADDATSQQLRAWLEECQRLADVADGVAHARFVEVLHSPLARELLRPLDLDADGAREGGVDLANFEHLVALFRKRALLAVAGGPADSFRDVDSSTDTPACRSRWA